MVSNKDLLGRTVYVVEDLEMKGYEFYTFIKPLDKGEKLLATKRITPALLKNLELWGQDKFLIDELKASMRMPK